MSSSGQSDALINGGKTFNDRIKRWRRPWSDLTDYEKQRRYRQAITAYQNGISDKEPGSYSNYAIGQVELDAYQRPKSVKVSPGQRLPAFFGTSARTQVLVLLWASGPITVRELARLRGTDSAATYRTVTRLLRDGLLAKREAVGARRCISVNRAHAASPYLRALLENLAIAYAIRVPKQSAGRYGLPLDRDARPPVDEDGLLGSSIRTRILLLVAAAGEIDQIQMARALGCNATSAWYASNALERIGMLRSRPVGARRVFVLRDGYRGADAYRAFLQAIVRQVPRYKVIAAALPTITRRLK